MFGVFSSLKCFLRLRAVCIHGVVFRLHSKLTVLILIGATILSSCRQYFGDPIICTEQSLDRRLIENYCWTHSTFILPHSWDKRVGNEVPYPGVDRYVTGEEKKYQTYYQWVALVLLLEAIFFYIPHYLWKVWENGMMKSLTLNLNLPALSTDEYCESYKVSIHALYIHWGKFSSYLMKYMLCELLTFLNVLFQMWLLDVFLGRAFSNFGIQVLQWTDWNEEHRTDPLVRAFPRMTQCSFRKYGVSGAVQRYDSMCLLPLNALNEKIFIFLWFWMVLLAGLTGFLLVYRLILFNLPILRYAVLKMKVPVVSADTLDKLVQNSEVSDWFVLYLLSKNLDYQHYSSVLNGLAAALEKKKFNPQLPASAPVKECLYFV